MAHRLRMRASRPEFRRGGHVFNSATWTVIDPATSAEQLQALLAEPVLAAQAEVEDGQWEPLPASDRQAIVEALTDYSPSVAAGLFPAAQPDTPREGLIEGGAGATAGPAGDDGRVPLSQIEPIPGDGREPLIDAPAAPPAASAPKPAAKVPAKPSAAATRKAKAGK